MQRFFEQIVASGPRGLAIHVGTANLAAHKGPGIATWLAHRDRPAGICISTHLKVLAESHRALVQKIHRGDHDLGLSLEP